MNTTICNARTLLQKYSGGVPASIFHTTGHPYWLSFSTHTFHVHSQIQCAFKMGWFHLGSVGCQAVGLAQRVLDQLSGPLHRQSAIQPRPHCT